MWLRYVDRHRHWRKRVRTIAQTNNSGSCFVTSGRFCVGSIKCPAWTPLMFSIKYSPKKLQRSDLTRRYNEAGRRSSSSLMHSFSSALATFIAATQRCRSTWHISCKASRRGLHMLLVTIVVEYFLREIIPLKRPLHNDVVSES